MRNKQTELRSERTRNIIGQAPPILLRYGIMIIGLSLFLLIGVSAFIPYQPTIDVQIAVTQDTNGWLHYTTDIPQKAMKKQSQFTEVKLNSSIELSLPTHYRIEKISENVTLKGQDTWYTALLSPMENTHKNIRLENPGIIPAKILLKKRSVLMWVIGKR